VLEAIEIDPQAPDDVAIACELVANKVGVQYCDHESGPQTVCVVEAKSPVNIFVFKSKTTKPRQSSASGVGACALL